MMFLSFEGSSVEESNTVATQLLLQNHSSVYFPGSLRCSYLNLYLTLILHTDLLEVLKALEASRVLHKPRLAFSIFCSFDWKALNHRKLILLFLNV